jgi:hypothetical protein
VVRIHGEQRGRRARLRLRERISGKARVGTGWRLTCARTPTFGREAGPRCRMLRVRVPPSARCTGSFQWAVGQLAARRALISDGSGSNPDRPALGRPAHACLVINGKHASPVRRQSGFDSPSRLAFGRSSVRSEHFVAIEEVASSNLVDHSHADLAQLAEAPRSGRGGSRFESAVRHQGE